jgi:hypothetical protein
VKQPLTLNLGAVEGKPAVKVDATAGNTSVVSAHPRRRVPLFSRSDQLYYWTREWQEGEAEALAELERGEGVVFEDPKEAVRWLREARG